MSRTPIRRSPPALADDGVDGGRRYARPCCLLPPPACRPAGHGELRDQAELYEPPIWALGKAGAIVPLQVLQGNRIQALRVPSMDRFEHFRSPPAL
jgi:hypothetical protein